MFDFSKLFSADHKNAALNAHVVGQARDHNQVSRLFINLAAEHGLGIPASKVAFEKYSREYITGAMHPFKGAGALKKGEFYRAAFAEIRSLMSMPNVTGPDWSPVITPEKIIAAQEKKEAKAAVKLQTEQAGKPSPMQAIITALNALTPEQLGAVMQACEVQLEALGYEAAITVHEEALM